MFWWSRHLTDSQSLFVLLGTCWEYYTEIDDVDSTGLSFAQFRKLLENDQLLQILDSTHNEINDLLEHEFNNNLSAKARLFFHESGTLVDVWDMNGLVDTIVLTEVFDKDFFESIERRFNAERLAERKEEFFMDYKDDGFEDYRGGLYGSQVDEIFKLSFENLSANFIDELAIYLGSESFSKFRDSALILIDSVTYKVLKEI
jgi:hypothetical protein